LRLFKKIHCEVAKATYKLNFASDFKMPHLLQYFR